MSPAPKGYCSKHSNGRAHGPGPWQEEKEKEGEPGMPVGRTVVRIAAPSWRLLEALRSDLGIESPNLQSSCRWWMDDA